MKSDSVVDYLSPESLTPSLRGFDWLQLVSLQWFVFSFCIIRYHSFIRWQCVAIACWYYGSVCCLDAVLVVSMCFFSPSGWRLCSVWNLHHPAVHSSQLVWDLLQVRLVYSAGGHWSLISDENRKLWSVGVCLSVCLSQYLMKQDTAFKTDSSYSLFFLSLCFFFFFLLLHRLVYNNITPYLPINTVRKTLEQFVYVLMWLLLCCCCCCI